MGNTVFARETEIVYLPIDMIRTNPYQPRKFFDRAGLEDLSGSIKEYGLMQPITVRIVNGNTYELVAGERRLRASKMAGLSSIPAIIVHASEQDSAILAMIENLQRQNLHFLEEAAGLQNLMADYSFTQDELAQKIGKSQSAVANKLRILRLSRNVQRVIIENELTERHARALLRLDSEEQQLAALKKVVREGLTVKKTEDLIEGMLNSLNAAVKPDKSANHKIKSMFRDMRIFTNTFQQTVEKMVQSGIEAKYNQKQTDYGYEITIRIEI